MVRVTAQAPLRPTEDPERVTQACTAFLPDAEVEVGDTLITAQASDVEPFRKRTWELRIIDTVRGQFLSGVDGGTVRVRLSKQAAYQGRISFPATPHALGDLDLTFTVEDGDPWPDGAALVAWLCPPTRDGEIVAD